MKKTVLITGAAKGIGNALAKQFAKNNYNVVINYLTSKEEAIALSKFLEQEYGINTLVIKADITDEQEVIDMINETTKHFNNIDVLINNAAYANDNPYTDKSKAEFLRVLEVNVVGTFLVTKYATQYMNHGTIINISSRDALDTYTELSMDYCASKAGVNSLTQTFSLAVPNNKFISIMLPWVNTESIKEMFPEYLENELKRTNQKRLLEPTEVATEVYNLVDNGNIKSGYIKKLEVK